MNIKINWQTKKLGEICDIINGSTPLRSNKEFWKNGNVPWFTIGDIRNQGKIIKYTQQKITKKALSKARLLPKQTVLLCCTASVGEYAITEIELTTNQQFNGLVVKNKKILDPFFLFYFSSTLKDQLLSLSGKTTIDFIPISRLKEIEIPLPPLPEQHRIVKILDEIFEKTAKAKANAEKNLQNAKELFESYLQSVFANPGKDWEKKRLGDVYDVRDGTHDSPKYQKVGYALITSKNLKGDELDYQKIKYISKKDYNKINERSKVHKGDILFAMIGTIGNPVVIKTEPDFAIKNVALFKIPKNQNSYFLKYFLDSKFVINKMRSEAKGTTQKFVGLGYLRNFKTQLPKLEEQESIVSKLDVLSAETKKLEANYKQKLADLEELKKSVLKKAFAGEL